MSHAVEPADLFVAAAPYGETPFLLYAGADGSARVNHVVARVEEHRPVVVVTGFGRGVQRALDAEATLSLLWPAPDSEEFSLIADGSGTIDESGASLTLEISAAVLHRPAPVDGNASC